MIEYSRRGETLENDIRFDGALLLLRVAVGFICVLHGLMKVFGFFGGPGIEGFANVLSSMGFTYALFWAWSAALAEFVGGVFLVFGIIPRTCAVLLGIVMLVAIVVVHWPYGFFAMNNGFEYPFLIFFVCVFFAFVGSGRFSLYNKF
ncbi:MAG: DoxX family protein [Candidatus Omnitrophota bacterium]